eukprot:gene14791-20841_t
MHINLKTLKPRLQLPRGAIPPVLSVRPCGRAQTVLRPVCRVSIEDAPVATIAVEHEDIASAAVEHEGIATAAVEHEDIDVATVEHEDISAAVEQDGIAVAAAEQDSVAATVASEIILKTFEDVGVDRLFLEGLKKMGAEFPSPIQEAAIPHVMSGQNVALQSYTGSGKTLAFLLPVITMALRRAEKLYSEKKVVPLQAVIVAPGQELAMQITRVAHAIFPDEGRKMVQQCIGGANPHRQIEALRANKPILVVGTPGRLADFVRNGKLKLHKCPVLVMDEADQLLAPNFAEDMAHITDHCGKRLDFPRQTVLVSATLTQSVLAKSEKWCPSPFAGAPSAAPAPGWGWGVQGWDAPGSKLGPKTQGAAGGVEAADGLVPTMPPQLKHVYIVAEHRHKVDCLRKSINALDSQRSLVFMNFQQRLKDTIFKLRAKKMPRLKDTIFKLRPQKMPVRVAWFMMVMVMRLKDTVFKPRAKKMRTGYSF